MADTNTEIKRVITVDTGDSIEKLSEYKDRIDSLISALDNLDKESEEYKSLASELADAQEQLNSIMTETKDANDRLSDSYNELGDHLDDIKDRIEELDDTSTEVKDNITEYGNAFGGAFDKMLDGVKKIDGPLGQVGGAVKDMIPVIRSVNSTAIAGLTGVKKAIASTGIGLLVVAVGMLATHWEDVKKAVSNLNPVTRQYNALLDETKRKVESIKKEWEAANIAQKLHLDIMQAQGKSTLEQLEYIRDNSKQRLADLDKANASLAKGMEEADRMIAKGAKAEELFGGQYAERLTEYNAYLTERLNLTKTISDAEWNITLENIKKETDARNEAEAEAKANEEKRKALYEEKKKLYEQERSEAEALYETIRKNSLSELELLEETYNEQKAQLERFGLDTTLLTAQYEEERKKIILEQEAEIQEKEQAYRNERLQNIKDNYDAEAEQLLFEAELEIENEQALADAKYQIEQDLLERKIALQEQYIEEYQGTQEGLIEAEAELDALRLQYANNKKKYDKETTDYAKQKAKEEKEAKMTALTASLSVAASVFGSLSDLAEENSEQYKAFAIMETTISTLEGAINAYKSMAGIPYVGPALGAAAAAAVTIAGIANINKIRSTTKNSSGGASVSAPTIDTPSMTTVSPLLDEQADMNRMDMSGMEGDSSQSQQNVRVYVVDQDIRDANRKAEVVEDNATF